MTLSPRSVPTQVQALLDLQGGVVSRSQALDAGLSRHDIDRMLRRHEWSVVHPCVYVEHTGPLTWQQRAWAAVLACWPAALEGRSAIRAHEGPGRHGAQTHPIEVVVARNRRIRSPAGVVVHRSASFESAVQWNLSPPRRRYDDAVIRVADAAGRDLDAIAVLSDACGARRTTAMRLRARLDQLPRLHRRAWLAQVLDDVATGTCSALEHGYLTLVERPHGLPAALRQVEVSSADGRRMFRDVVYRGRRPEWTQIVELDGRLGHDGTTARDRDLERDLDAALVREHTVRIGDGQVFKRGCATAAKVARLLQARGWLGEAHACPRCAESPE
ncbi:type IV toxin-antitoxin system AbiEi family antitoxin domain-containing protein [Nocardioides kongjuensis]|uniref:Type IV toxin-antitoxin system AbiEi family antitoxin domain-containing protein n=1 Tax=Nocardioides kongjuensis TaxID=349522 RepID=A0A852RRC3_9ACTN|nr:type IV toxin-antitoxin system AbiEi family antitoxin domain-containing protein [Nocardioides kongjuensis]NYD31796.1 hypothetical protein [Nocardioides kongjuensis]